MDWIKRYAGWIVAALAVIYAANTTGGQSSEAYYSVPPLPEVATPSYVETEYQPPSVEEPPPATPAPPPKGWYDPRYVSCVANCDNVEPRILTEAEIASAPHLVYRAQATPTSEVPPSNAAYSLPPMAPPSSVTGSPGYEAPAYASAETPPPAPAALPSCAENGSCYGDISAATGRPKTVAVQGYYRSDGTYVRGHYRSRPR